MDTSADASPSMPFDETNSPFDASNENTKSPQPADISITTDATPGTPRKKKAGRQVADNSEETKQRHSALYQYYKANPQLSQSKLASWFQETYQTTMSQCSVSQILKKQKLANGEPVEEPKPRPGKRKHLLKDEDNEPNKKGRKSLEANSIIGTPNGQQIPPTSMASYPTPQSERRATAGFQAVNSNHTPVTFSHYPTPGALAQAALTPGLHNVQGQVAARTESRNTYISQSGRTASVVTSRFSTSTQPFNSAIPQTPQAQIASSRRTSMLPNKSVNGTPAEDIYTSISEGIPPPGTTLSTNAAQLQSELNASRLTVNEYMKIVQKQESLIDNVLKNQHDDRERVRSLESQCEKLRTENEMLKNGTSDSQLKELLDSVKNLTRSLEKEREKNVKLAELFSEEENIFRELVTKRSTAFPLGMSE